MPKLWKDTIETHRREVRDTILSTTATLVFERGLLAVTMSQIAEETGIGRATLYKYFPDIESILAAWHSREIAGHLHQLAEVRDQEGDSEVRLRAVLSTFALITFRTRGHLDAELVRLLHKGEHIVHAQQQMSGLISGLISEAAGSGLLRGDVSAEELAAYCLHALSAAGAASSEDAVRRLVDVTMSGLRPTAP